MIKACIFDLDGTLLDTLPDIHYHLCRTLERYGVGAITLEECRAFIGNGAEKLVRRALLTRDAEVERLLPLVLAHYNDAYDRESCLLTKPYEGMVELIEALDRRGVRLAVVSNKPEPTVKQLCRRFFGDRISLVIGGGSAHPLKPNPASGRFVLDSFGATARECAVIGDSEVDVAFGNALGARLTVGVGWGFRSPRQLSEGGEHRFAPDAAALAALLS